MPQTAALCRGGALRPLRGLLRRGREKRSRETGGPAAEPAPPEAAEPVAAAREKTGSMELRYAGQFRVDYFSDGTAEITIGESDRYVLVP